MYTDPRCKKKFVGKSLMLPIPIMNEERLSHCKNMCLEKFTKNLLVKLVNLLLQQRKQDINGKV